MKTVPFYSSMLLLCLLLMSNPSLSNADEIVLENGDRLTGTVKSADGDSLILETDYSDPVKISKSKIKRISMNEPAEVRLSGGEVLKGTIRSEEDGKVVVGGSQGREESAVDWASVAALNPPPSDLSKWTGNVTISAGLQSGNTERTNASLGAEATRRSKNDRFTLRFQHNYAEEDDVATTRNTYGAMKYDYFFTKKLYAYLAVDLLHDSFKNLNLRTVVGPGVGYQVWEDEKKSLLFEAGVSYFSEDIEDGEDKDWITGRFASDVRYTLRGVLLSNNLVVYPSFEDFGEYTLRNEASLASPLAAGWSLKLSNILEHDSEPPENIKKDDWYWLLGLDYGF